MQDLLAVPLISKNGVRGKVMTASRLLDDSPVRTVVFESGRAAVIPAEHLHPQKDGSFYLDLTVDPRGPDTEPQAAPVVTGDVVIPRVEEQLVIDKRTVETGRVRVSKTVVESAESIQEPLVYESYEVERVPINREVTETSAARTDGDVTIVPVYEEQIVMVKVLILREEIRLTKTRREEQRPRTVTLKKEEVKIERSSPVPGHTPSR